MSRAPEWTVAEIATFHRLYPEQGPKAVAAATGRPYGSIKVRAHRHGLRTTASRIGNGQKYDPIAVVEILERHDWSPSKAARFIGCCVTTVAKARKLADARRKEAVPARRAERDAMITKHLEGMLA